MYLSLKVYRKIAYFKALKFIRRLNPRKDGINLIGFFSYTFGVAEIGRFFAKRMLGSNIPFVIYDIETISYHKVDSETLSQFVKYYSRKTKFHKNIFFLNADTINRIEDEHPKLFISRFNAAVFFWEFDDYFNFPEAFRSLNEVIAFTEFIATAVRKVAPKHVKVTHLPIPFVKSWQIVKTREEVKGELGIEVQDFMFIFNFDFHSVYNRKNPEAILRAFELAFNENDRVCLILKTINAERVNKHFEHFTMVVDQMKMKGKIRVINDNMSRNEFMSMINAADCYISLHRSEGLGLGMMEAMSMGKPVIATRYGGNTDFMNDENALMVNYTLVPVAEGSEPYKTGWLWADANVEEAASYMRQLYQDRHFSENLGRKAQEYISNNYSQQRFTSVLHTWMKNC